MKIYTLNLGELQSNCYVAETSPGRCIAIDIGNDADVLLCLLEEKKLKLNKILLTHGHFDHIGGVADVVKQTNAQVFIHTDDAYMLKSAEASLSNSISDSPFKPVENYVGVYGDCIINDGKYDFKVIHTPGHTPGGVCYVCDDVIFSGDTLFRLSIGRTDFKGGSFDALQNSLIRLFALDGDYKIYPGHGLPTTLDFERKNNPYSSPIN